MAEGLRPLLVDTDGGIDDCVAVWWLLDRDDVEIVGITVVHGNVATEVAAANIGRVLEAHGSTGIPIALGATVPYGPAPAMRPADFIHGADGLGDTNRPAPVTLPGTETATELISRLAAAHEGSLEILTLGPLSNLAHALDDVPSLVAATKSITVMGGVIASCGNAQPIGEANIANDPTAAQRVVTAGFTDATLVGLDVTHTGTFTGEQFALVEEQRNAAARFLCEPLRFYRRFGGAFCIEGECPCHDLLAAMVAVRPELVDGPVLPLAVQTAPGPAWGATVADRRQPFFDRAGEGSVQNVPEGFAPWKCAMTTDVAGFRAEVDSLFGG
ncbi:MAG: nucleoside hydrolase [Ilumatobacter sp.]|uniref:nucleoside hydrolase n=1 Tax=Ilumatobacter sp. TaxID=1967498 RepID=UPI00329A0A7D